MNVPDSPSSLGASEPAASASATTEQLRTFLAAWAARDWRRMAGAVQASRRLRLGDALAKRLEGLYGNIGLARWKVLDQLPWNASALATVRVEVFVRYPNDTLEREIRLVNLIREDDAGRPIPRDVVHPTARWGVNDSSALRVEGRRG